MAMTTLTFNRKLDLEKLKSDVQRKFDKIREALNVREKLLLRQIDVILTTSQLHKSSSPVQSTVQNSPPPAVDQEIKLLTENEEQLINAIRSFGRFNLDNINLALHTVDACMKNEDYIAPGIDHETLYKCLGNEKTQQKMTAKSSADYNSGASGEDDKEPEAIVVDFSHNKKLIQDNVSTMNDSIINITLNEAKELIRKAKSKRNLIPPLNLEALDEALESSSMAEEVISVAVSLQSEEAEEQSHHTIDFKTKSSQTEGAGRKARTLNPKITINNCNGTINLKNISNLTINCATEEAVRAEISLPEDQKEQDQQEPKPKVPSTSTNSSSSASSPSPISSTAVGKGDARKKSNSSRSAAGEKSISKTTTTSNSAPAFDLENDDNSVNCEFYNRLLNEIKNSLKQKTRTTKLDNQRYQGSSNSSTTYDNDPSTNSNLHTQSATTTTTSSHCTNNNNNNTKNRKFILKNFENLKLILESNVDGNGDQEGGAGSTLHPVQIEQWLAEIISETEIEPMQNTDILEHSKLNDEAC